MNFHALSLGEERNRFLPVIEQGLALERHVDLLHWLQGDVQHHLPHDILLAGWGDFREGPIAHDLLSKLPGVRSYAAGTESLAFLLRKFHTLWVGAQRQPCRLNFRESEYLRGSSRPEASFRSALQNMRTVLIHGLRDERSGHECLYVVMSAAEIPAEPAGTAMKVLIPFVDSALRRITQLPQQHTQTSLSLQTAQEELLGLSEREVQVMAWVAMGKTNSEIGDILNISGCTVKNHMQRIFRKLNVFNRAQAVSKVTRVTPYG